MKKIMIIALTLVLTAAALTGCGCVANVGTATEPSTTVAPTTMPTEAPTTLPPTTAPTTEPSTRPTTAPDTQPTSPIIPGPGNGADNMPGGGVDGGNADTGPSESTGEGIMGRSRGIRRR